MGILFKISECLHLLGMRCGGKCSTLPIAPKQSEMTVTNPLNAGAISFMLRRIRCIAISPRNNLLGKCIPRKASGTDGNTSYSTNYKRNGPSIEWVSIDHLQLLRGIGRVEHLPPHRIPSRCKH